MKRIILIVMVCCLIPCFGIFNQASASAFSIEETLWRARVLGLSNLPDGRHHVDLLVVKMGFYNDTVYGCVSEDGNTCEMIEQPDVSYIDCPVLSMAYYCGPYPITGEGRAFVLAIMQPIGIGYLTVLTHGLVDDPFGEGPHRVYVHHTGIMVKESDNWLPE